MDTPDAAAAPAAGDDGRGQPGRAGDAGPAGHTEAEDLRRTASLALASAIRRHRETAAPGFAPLRVPATAGGPGRFPGRRADGRQAAQADPRGGVH